MLLTVKPGTLTGIVNPPTSKSHTIRAIIIGSLAEGETKIVNPLISSDSLAPIKGCKLLGANFIWENEGQKLIVNGTDGQLITPKEKIQVANSGTTLYFLSGVCSNLTEVTVLTGDKSINNRPISPLITALNNLGGKCSSSVAGTPPVVIQGPLHGGETEISGTTSQYTSSLLLSTPIAINDSVIKPNNLQEKPYVEMTLDYLNMSGIKFKTNETLSNFQVVGNQRYKSFTKKIPCDFSSAAFIIGAGVLAGSDLKIKGLNFDDSQADKELITILKQMGADIRIADNEIIVNQSNLAGIDIDLSQSPDLLPIVSVIATQASNSTTIYNVEHARIKETDRISAMKNELTKLNGKIIERNDGLEITQSKIKGNKVQGYHDHRITMALAIAGIIAEGKTIISSAESINVTYPNFVTDLNSLGANIKLLK